MKRSETEERRRSAGLQLASPHISCCRVKLFAYTAAANPWDGANQPVAN